MAEAFLAGLIGFLIGRGVEPQDATAVVEALRAYLGFEPPLGLTGYALEGIEKGKQANSAVVVRGKAYDVVALDNIARHSCVSVLGKKGERLEVAPTIESLKLIEAVNLIDAAMRSTQYVSAVVSCPYFVESLVKSVSGQGELVSAELEFRINTPPALADYYTIYVYADGVRAYVTTNREITQSITATYGRCAIGEFYQWAAGEVARTYMSLRLPIRFKEKIELKAMQSCVAETSVAGWLSLNVVT